MKRRKGKLPAPKVMRLKDKHTWVAPAGYNIVVVDRGAASFNIPNGWEVTGFEPFTIRDKPEPDDNMALQVTVFHLPPGIDWSGLPLAPMLTSGIKRDDPDILAQSEIYTPARDDLELVWMEQRFIDPNERREAFSRFLLARGWNVQVLMTLSYWVADEPIALPIWEEIVRSLQLGRVIDDPTKGITHH
jgi:hypothetical protein